MARFNVELLPSPLSDLGEGPHWDIETQSLYYNDIYGGFINRYDYGQNKTFSATVDGEPVISFIIPIEGTKDEFAIGIGRRVGIVQWDGVSPSAKLIRIAKEVETDGKYCNNRFNDAKCDPRGRLFAGTMRLEIDGNIFEERLGALYCIEKSSDPKKIRNFIGCSNGLTWNEKTNTFYYIDSTTNDIQQFDWNPETGAINNRKILIAFPYDGLAIDNVADGMTIDTEGNLYVAFFHGGRVSKINTKTGKVEFDIKIPGATQVTSAAFGGPNLDELFVTTAGRPFECPQPPPAGSLYKITGLGVKGGKMHKVRL